ncbi:alcohol dehydrogenase catalytic domain-containing protein [Lactobacillus sp. ESL0684]|uniref:alcohol dehydrogenase catalytic domain-containing protein n=1 Tax=Lactobacillus sp. ESL0684 TaxID=2983213 RepID=UPI0023F6F153|nr:alcohol dehydrogenase catalytic domain-containing protein [Lactobacillus sp. ESL0684]WEV43836.1 alcohol dehydrogenase catalytic domain-containing protein [Lactobacillus sp. ESL0684]
MRGFGMIDKGKVDWIELAEPKLVRETDAIIKITGVAFCTSDIHLVESGIMPSMKGHVIGHEAIGIVDKVGSQVHDFKSGDRVVVHDFSPNYGDLTSQAGMANYSPNSSRTTNPNLDGLFTEKVLFERADSGLAHIPDNVTDTQALMVADMVPTALTGIDFLDIKFGETVLVIGIGPVGLIGVEGAAIDGAGKIIAVGSRPATKQVAREYGANVIIDYHDGPIVDQVLAANNNQKVDKVLVAGGNNSVIMDAFNLTRNGGKIANLTLFTVPEISIPTSPSVGDVAYRTLSLNAGRLYLEQLLSLISYGRIHPENIVTRAYHGFDKIPDSFTYMANKGSDVIKSIVLY